MGRRTRPDGRLKELKRAYNEADERGDLAGVLARLGEITAEFPDVSWGWYDLGLRHKWLRNWELSRDCNLRALELVEAAAAAEGRSPEGEVAEAWNLGIAATALGDWATARRAWRAFGIDVPGEGEEPVAADFGPAPIRLNPDPRYDEPELLIDGVRFDPEVVWATRLCPTRARIESVPSAASGHRFGDVVLHDGDPVGERRLGERVVGVFNEIALLERGPWPTWETVLPLPPEPDDVRALEEAFYDAGYAGSCWTMNTRVLCKACSEGPAGAGHDHAPDQEPEREVTSLSFGIAAPADEASRLLDEWVAAGTGRDRGPVLPA